MTATTVHPIVDYKSEAKSLPCDESLLEHVGRVMWNAIYLHGTIRDVINLIHSKPSDKPFEMTLGQAVKKLSNLAPLLPKDESVALREWCSGMGESVADERDGVAHAVVFGGPGGVAALRGSKSTRPPRYQEQELVQVAGRLALAAKSLDGIRMEIYRSRTRSAPLSKS